MGLFTLGDKQWDKNTMTIGLRNRIKVMTDQKIRDVLHPDGNYVPYPPSQLLLFILPQVGLPR